MNRLSLWTGASALFLFSFIATQSNAQETRIRFFGQPGVEQTYNPKFQEGSVYFRGGGFIMYVTSQLNEKISVAAELNPHYMVKTGAEVEIERIFLRYYIKDYFSVRIGRMYNPLGFWNTNYNFGLLLQPTISRPQILQPLHDEGFTQTRDAGFQIEGNEMGSARFFYKFMIGNGISKNGGIGGTAYALGKDLGYTANLGIEPKDGLKLMVSGYYDDVLTGQITNFGDTVKEDVNYYVLSGSVVYMNPEQKTEFIAEYFAHNYRYESIGTKTTHGAYAYAGYKLTEKFIPYAFAQLALLDDSNPYYNTPKQTIGLESTKSLSLGARYRFDPNAVLKLEYQVTYGDVSEYSFGPRLQFAFGF